MLGDDDLKRDLASRALGWAKREIEEHSPLADGPLSLLVALRTPDAHTLLTEARSIGGSVLQLSLNDLESCLETGTDPLALTRTLMEGTWRETAARLRKLFHPTREERLQLRELAASLRPKADVL